MKKEYPLKKLAQQYYLTEHSIRRIIRQQKRYINKKSVLIILIDN